MALRCLLFSSDEGTAEPIRRVLSDLRIEAEYCPVAVEAADKVTRQPLNIVIIDWDNQPEAGLLLNSARQRKAQERPLTLAIVSSDASVPQALQAGANSILRKPIQINHVRDTLTTAQDLLRSKQEAPPALSSTSGGGAAAAPVMAPDPADKALRAGEFLQSTTTPSAQFDTESDVEKSLEQAAVAEVDPLKNLEPMAGSVVAEPTAPPPSDEPRGLSYYMNRRAQTAPTAANRAPAPQNELLSYDQIVSQTAPAASTDATSAARSAEQSSRAAHDTRSEAMLFAYIAGEKPQDHEPRPLPPWLKKVALAVAVLAPCIAVSVAVPRWWWQKHTRQLVSSVSNTGHNLLNPPPVAPKQVPTTHEDFGRPGDEYKLPIAENIPDATTDPSQIRVIPVIDPTAKQPNGNAANTGQGSTQPGITNQTTSDQPSPTAVQATDNQPADTAPVTIQAPADQPGNVAASPTASTNVPAEPAHSASVPPAPVAPQLDPMQPRSQKPAQTRPISVMPATSIPSSLKSQMATTTPEASGNKPVEAALPSIEPVNLPEATAQALLAEGPAPAYPATAKGLQGTVVLQVLIGRDGTVQDAKFLQGSLAFARNAIDAIKQWKFKPYVMNNRPVSVQTQLSITFRPGS